MESVAQYATDLGAAVVLPVIIFLFALVLGEKAGNAFRAGVKIGVGFVGVGLVIGPCSDRSTRPRRGWSRSSGSA